jgi:hypothetical protein
MHGCVYWDVIFSNIRKSDTFCQRKLLWNRFNYLAVIPNMTCNDKQQTDAKRSAHTRNNTVSLCKHVWAFLPLFYNKFNISFSIPCFCSEFDTDSAHQDCETDARFTYLTVLFRGKRPLGRPTHRLEDDIKMNPQEVGCGALNWICLAQDRDRWQALVNAVMNLRVPQYAWNFLTSWGRISFLGMTLFHGDS